MRLPLPCLAWPLLLCLRAGAQELEPTHPPDDAGFTMAVGPGPVSVDAFHPERERSSRPSRGGDLVVHVPALPRSLNYMIESSSTARRILNELHEPLLRRDWESWEWTGVLAERWTVEDVLRVVPGAGPARIGRVRREGDDYLVVGADAAGRATSEAVPARDVVRLDRDTAWTFHLRPGVRWHDGHALDVGDVLFSYSCYRNPEVRCDRKRYLFEKLESAEAVGERAVRFVFKEPYFLAASVFDDSFTILPAHLYDLSDPDHPEHDSTSAEQQGRAVNESAHNRAWVGLGPYRVVSWEGERLACARFEDYFDPDRAGWVDAITWRAVRDPSAAFQAFLEGELDFFEWLTTDQLFGPETRSEAFLERGYTGWFYTPYVGYTAWNTRREQLADARVRRALGLAFDWDGFARDWYRGLALRATGEQYYPTDNYDRTLAPLPFDLEESAALLAAAGWYDRDQDGYVDRDGERLSIALNYPAGNATSEAFGLRFQELLKVVGVELELAPLEFAALSKAVGERDFDAVALGWVLDFESDPEPVWHSRWSQGDSANRAGLADDQVDALIESVQRELDPAARAALLHRLQARLHELQPVQFGLYVPRRFAMARKLRGVQLFALDPGYSLRRWWIDEGR